MKVEQHIPNFCDEFKLAQSYFTNTKELLNIKWIKSFASDKNFYRFSIHRDVSEMLDKSDKPQHTLMAEYENGLTWWVIAFIRNKNISGINDLPEWKPKY